MRAVSGLQNLFSLQDSLRLLAVWHALPGLAPGFCAQPPIWSPVFLPPLSLPRRCLCTS